MSAGGHGPLPFTHWMTISGGWRLSAGVSGIRQMPAPAGMPKWMISPTLPRRQLRCVQVNQISSMPARERASTITMRLAGMGFLKQPTADKRGGSCRRLPAIASFAMSIGLLSIPMTPMSYWQQQIVACIAAATGHSMDAGLQSRPSPTDYCQPG
jgi:hypothetical protein